MPFLPSGLETVWSIINSASLKPYELIFAFDGRSRARRKLLLEKLTDADSWVEAVLTYRKQQNKEAESKTGAGRVRRTVLSETLHEYYLCKFGASRSKVICEGNVTTVRDAHLDLPRQLPRVKQDNKREIMKMDASLSVAPTGLAEDEGVPLFWGECKSQQFWESWIDTWKGVIVVDFRATTQLPLACLQKGIPYLGFVQNDVSWQNSNV